MPATAITELDYRPSYLAAAATGAAVFLIYLLTLAPSTAMWDTSEYIAAAYVVGLPHPPGNPLFVLLGRVFALLPIAPNVAMRINILAAVTSAATAAMWFLVTERVLVSWLESRWQRIVGGVLGALVGATAFTVWNQSVVNEKVYTISLFGLAVISWLTVRWSDDPEGPKADRILVVIAYLLGLGYTNHMMGMLAAPAVAVAVLIRRPDTLLRWRLLLACGAVMFLGMTVFATQPIRAGFFPAINEGEPTTWDSFWYNFNRGQYGKPSVMERQAPFSAQIGSASIGAAERAAGRRVGRWRSHSRARGQARPTLPKDRAPPVRRAVARAEVVHDLHRRRQRPRARIVSADHRRDDGGL
jgi:hypothetical protein